MNRYALRGKKKQWVVVGFFFLLQVNRKCSTGFQRVSLLCDASAQNLQEGKTSRRCLIDVTIGHIGLVRIWEA